MPESQDNRAARAVNPPTFESLPRLRRGRDHDRDAARHLEREDEQREAIRGVLTRLAEGQP